MMRFCISVFLTTCLAVSAVWAADRPNNPVGVHLMIHDARTAENIENHTAWAQRMCGPWGYVKIFEYGITPTTEGPDADQVKLINKLYERELIPVVRIGGKYTGRWERPADTPDGTFEDIAQAFKRVVAGYPLSDECPLYIEVWNEANLGLEWSGTPIPPDFAKMYVAAAKAIRSLNDPRIRIAPGAMSPGGEYNSLKFLEACCKAEPEFIHSFDYWATHPYPGATPPDRNAHNGQKASRFASIDLWVHELKVLADNGCDTSKLKVIGTETSYRLGHGGDGENPLIDKERRADYHLRTIRDHWTKWPDVLGMCIWEWAEPFKKVTNSTWVHAESTTDETGWPSMPTLDYEYITALAKPTSDYACISGKLIDARTKAGIPDVVVTLDGTDLKFTTDRFGNYILSPVDPNKNPQCTVRFTSKSHGDGKFTCQVAKAGNLVVDKMLNARKHAHLRGYAINTATGRHLPGAEVTIEPGHFRKQATSIGLFEFTDIPHGTYEVIVEKRDFYPHRQRNLKLTADRMTEHRYRLGPGEEVEDNLIRNGGFEGADAGEDAALGWGGAGLALDSKIAYAGDHSQQLTAITDDTANLIQWTNYSTIQAGHRYRVQCWARTEGVVAPEGKGLALTGTVVNNPHKTLAELRSKQVLTGDQPWTLLAIEFTAPADAGRVSVDVKLDADEGTGWIDEAAVMEIPIPGVTEMYKMPGKSYRGPLPPLTDEEASLRDRLTQHVKVLADDIGERHIGKPDALQAAATYVEMQWKELGYKPADQTYTVADVTSRNIDVEKTGTSQPDTIVVVGAHYDSVPGCPAANDNGTGVAGLLEISRLLKDTPLDRTVRFVAFVNEEPPFFHTKDMGSLIYAKRSHHRGDKIAGMISLETIGCYSDEKGSQLYPPMVSMFYPSQGDFIGFASNPSSRPLLHKVIGDFREHTSFPSEGLSAPEILPGIAWSDHWSFWQVGYQAIMVTDTAPFRYQHYHTATDTPDKIDFDRTARVVAGLARVVKNLAAAE